MTRPIAPLVLALTLTGAPIASADVTVSGAIYRTDVPGYLRDYQGGPLASIGRGVTYDRQTVADSLLSDTASGGGPGFIYSRSFAQYRLLVGSPGDPSGFSFAANSVADAIWSDIVISGPAGPAMVPFSINIFLEGFAILGSVGPNNATVSSATASFAARINDVVAASGILVRTASGGGPTQTPIASGVFANFSGSRLFATDTVMVPVNTPFSISVQLQTFARDDVTYTYSGTTTALMNFGDTASLATTGPAFNVPAGYTVNSVEARVRNNTYVPCHCDWDHSGAIDSQDFFEFLTAFFAGTADFNHDGMTTSQDFFDFLACFFAGCP